MKAPLATITAISAGLVILAGYFFPLSPLREIQQLLLGWAVILAGIAALVGILNLVITHLRKFNAGKGKQDIYSLFLLLSFLITFIAGMWFGPSHPAIQHIITSVQMPVETSLLALLAITLAYTSLKLLKRRRDWVTILFVASTVVFLLISSGLMTTGMNIEPFQFLLAILNRLPVAGARGILLGVALGSLTTGLRILLGADRPYGG